MKKILLVEDSEMVRFALSALLQDSGYAVAEAVDGKIALKALQHQRFDLMLTDIFMPKVDGIELITRVRKEYPGVKIIAFSGGGARQPPEFAMRLATALGAHATMQKPVDSDALLAELDALMRKAA